jgi:hypothetical protein
MKVEFLISGILFSVLLFYIASANAEVIYSENYDGITSRLNCSDGGLSNPPRTAQGAQTDWGWWAGSACKTDTVGGITHYDGEITTRGRNGGQCLTLWRRYCSDALYISYTGGEISATVEQLGYPTESTHSIHWM